VADITADPWRPESEPPDAKASKPPSENRERTANDHDRRHHSPRKAGAARYTSIAQQAVYPARCNTRPPESSQATFAQDFWSPHNRSRRSQRR